MEEEKKEEVVESTPTPTLEPVVTTNEVKQENNNKGKGGTIVLVILLILALGAGGFFAYKYFTKEDTKPKEEEKKEETKTDDTIKYEIKGETLYVNGNKVENINAEAVDKKQIYQIKDALLVVECFDSCSMHMVDKDGKIFKGIKGKLNNGTNFSEVKENDIYFASYAEVFYQDESLLCNFKDDDTVYVEEKITYLGNKSFSEQTQVSSKTKEEYLNGRTINCSSTTPKEESKISYNIKDNELYVNNKKVNHPDGVSSLGIDKDNIYDLGDLLLVGDCRSTCDWYFIDGNANTVGSLGKPDQVLGNITIKELVKTKFEFIQVQKVEGKTIYFYDHGYTTQDSYSICKYKDSDPVYYEEKVTYNGSNTFGTPQTVLSKTRAQIAKEDLRFAISDKDCNA